LIEKYNEKKGHVPKNINILLKYMEREGFYIFDYENETVYRSATPDGRLGWYNCKAFGTVANWLREYSAKHSSRIADYM
jgi:hypothetical protein